VKSRKGKAGGSGEGNCSGSRASGDGDARDCGGGFCVEAVPEKMEIKRAVAERSGQHFASRSDYCEQHFLDFDATLAAADETAGPVCGDALHESGRDGAGGVIRALQTSDATFETTMKLARSWRKKPVR